MTTKKQPMQYSEVFNHLLGKATVSMLHPKKDGRFTLTYIGSANTNIFSKIILDSHKELMHNKEQSKENKERVSVLSQMIESGADIDELMKQAKEVVRNKCHTGEPIDDGLIGELR